jgi:hypothetical protein
MTTRTTSHTANTATVRPRNATHTTSDGIDTEGRDRALSDEESARESGLAFTEPTLFAVGTRLCESGRESYDRSRMEFEHRPLLSDALDLARQDFEKQGRVDFRCPNLRNVEMTPAGLLVDCNDKPMPRDMGIGKHALGQAISRLGCSSSSSAYLAACPVGLRAHNWNEWADPSGKPVVALVRTMRDRRSDEDPKGSIAGYGQGSDRAAYAVLSERYQTRDLPDVAQDFLAALAATGADKGARGDYLLAGPKWRLRATFHSSFKSDALVVGDIFRGEVSISGSDDGTGSVRVTVGVERARCVNLTTIWAKDVQGLRHNSRDFVRKLGEMLLRASGQIAGFAAKWAEAAESSIIDGVWGGGDPKPIFVALVAGGYVRLPGVSREDLADRLCAAWRAEPGYSRAAIVNAVTRAAHTQSWRSPWAQDELEEQAGRILYNRVVITPGTEESAS